MIDMHLRQVVLGMKSLCRRWDTRVKPRLHEAPALRSADRLRQRFAVVIRMRVTEGGSDGVIEILAVDEGYGGLSEGSIAMTSPKR